MTVRRPFLAATLLAAGLAATAAPAGVDAERFARLVDGREAVDAAYPDTAFVTLERTRCNGSCPAYTVRVDGAGRVAFEGTYGTCEERPAPVRVPRAAAQRLLAALDAAGVARLPDFDREDRTDAPGAVVTLDLGRGAHRVRHSRGMDGVPPLVPAVEDAIDRVAGDARWLPGGDPRACTGADGERFSFDKSGNRRPVR